MSYFHDKDEGVYFRDSANLDAFSRLRVSQLTTQVDLKYLHDKQPLIVDEEVNGTASSTHTAAASQVEMNTLANGDWIVRQTKQRFNYQSGKSQFIAMTFADFDAVTDVVKRVGYFSSSTTSPYTATLDGLFLEQDGDVSINIWREGNLTEQTDQSSWNLDTLDGNGKSGITIDWQDSQILIIDFQYLGVGRVRWGLDIDGEIIYFHESLHANNGMQQVYMASPNQPLRWELRQNGATTGGFTTICSTVNTEGALNKVGRIYSVNQGTTHTDANSTASYYALIGIRLKSTHPDTFVDVLKNSIMTISNDNVLWELRLNPTVAGTFTYSGITNTCMEYATGATANTVTGGTVVDSGYIYQNSSVANVAENAIRLGSAIDGTMDEYVLCAKPFTSNSDIIGSITWREIT